ncbi:type II secretion system F family protein [Streptomyces sp. NPDC021093]|uniref:type II secretion system F family protein n=1 Tax=Streptomyces sp. NPDC021093 TaxID=3365112 RepID=UPI00379A2A58
MNGEVVHRLGVVVCAAAAVGCLAFAVAGRSREREARRRLATLLAVEAAVYGAGRRGRFRGGAEWVRGWGGPAGAVVAGYVLVGGVWGCLVGAVAAVGVRRWQRGRQPRGDAAAEDAAAGRQLPLAADLLAACVAAGAGPREAAEAVGESLGRPVGERLARAAAELRLGGEPAEAWGRLAAIPGAAGLARCLERAGASGAPAAGQVGRVADGLRAERARRAEAAANRAGVLIVVPLSLCFLPAFLVVGVAPVVIGLGEGLLAGG